MKILSGIPGFAKKVCIQHRMPKITVETAAAASIDDESYCRVRVMAAPLMATITEMKNISMTARNHSGPMTI